MNSVQGIEIEIRDFHSCVLTEYEGNDEISSKLEECRNDLSLNGAVVLEKWFPVLNLVIRKFSEFDTSIHEQCWMILMHELEVHVNDLMDFDLLALELNSKRLLRNCTKILCFLAVGLAEKFENESILLSTKEKKLKKNTRSSFLWDKQRQILMTRMECLCKLELVQLWEPPSAPMMEDLSAIIASLCYNLLENSTIVRDKLLLDSIAELLGLIVTKYGLTLSVELKLLQLLQHFDHLANPISFIVITIATRHSFSHIALNIVREIGSMDPSQLAMDSTGTKCFVSFLVSISERIPAVILPAVPVLLPHLNGESTTFRNGVLGVFGEVLKLLPDSSNNSDLFHQDVRDEMLKRLIDHLHDNNAFVRVKVLHVFLQLCSAQVIPLPVLQGLLERVAGRLKDRSSLVRKGAFQLLCAMLSYNPFAAKLDKNEFLKRYEEERVLSANADEGSSENLVVTKYLQEALDFVSSMALCVPIAVEMLKSKVVSDVLESLEFLSMAKLFQLDGAGEAISKSLPLVWSQDEQLRNAVVSIYVRLYLTANGHTSSEQHSKLVVGNLLQIISNATSGELASLEKLVGLLVVGGHIPPLAVKELWKIFHSSGKGKKESILACQLLSMAIPMEASTSSVLSDVDCLMSGGLAQSHDLILLKHTCCAICKIAQSRQVTRLSSAHNLFNKISLLLMTNFQNLVTSHWIPFCEQALNVVYLLSEQPNCFSETLLKDLSQVVFKVQDGANSVLLSRLIFCAGHIALCQVTYCELTVLKERKKIKMEHMYTTVTKGEDEEELGLMGNDEQEVDLVHKVMETEVGGAAGMLAVFEPLLVCITTNPSKFPCTKLQTAAALSLSKFMLISSTQCDKYLQLFFTILEKSSLASIRANLIIAASDLVCRFPSTIEPWTPFMYDRLKDQCSLVRKNTMMVLTHLILNDMIKIRGQISAMALCLEDEDYSIVELAKVFFYELSKKGNTLYNVVPDIISQLSVCGVCSQESFKNIIRHIFQFIKKEKHHENLIEKLCHRWRAIRTERQACDLAYCMSLFMPTEKGLLKLQENFSCYQEKLSDTVICKYILAFISKAKKVGKDEVKTLAELLEKKIHDVMQVGSQVTESTNFQGTPILQLDDQEDTNLEGGPSLQEDALNEARKLANVQ